MSVAVLLGLDIDGVLCDIGPSVSARISERFGVASHPATWRSYDLRRLRIGVPEAHFHEFLDHTFADPELYHQAPLVEGVSGAMAALVDAGWDLVGITARAPQLAEATREWLGRHGLPLHSVHHAAMLEKSEVAQRLGVAATIEDNPEEAELLAEVCDSWLFDRPYNRDHVSIRTRRLMSWGDGVGRLCQLRLFA